VHQKLASVTEESSSRSLNFSQKSAVALVLFGAVALLAWQTMEPGKFRNVLLGWRRSGVDAESR
jgi:hypothetical protein